MTSNALALCTAVLAGTFAAFPSAAAERRAPKVDGEYWMAGSPNDDTTYFIPKPPAEETCEIPATTEWDLWSAGSPGDETIYNVPRTPSDEARPALAAATDWEVWSAGSPGDDTVYYVPGATDDTRALASVAGRETAKTAATGGDAPSRCAGYTRGASGHEG